MRTPRPPELGIIAAAFGATVAHAGVHFLSSPLSVASGLMAVVLAMVTPAIIWYDSGQIERTKGVKISPWYFIPLSMLPYGVGLLGAGWYVKVRMELVA